MSASIVGNDSHSQWLSFEFNRHKSAKQVAAYRICLARKSWKCQTTVKLRTQTTALLQITVGVYATVAIMPLKIGLRSTYLVSEDFFTTIRYGQSTICNMYVEHSEDYNLIGIIPQNLSFCTVKLRRDFLIAQFSSEPCRIMVKMNGFSA